MFEKVLRRPVGNIPYISGKSDAAFLLFMDNLLFLNIILAKLQSYMVCEIPIIASSASESKIIIANAGCGMVVKLGIVKYW